MNYSEAEIKMFGMLNKEHLLMLDVSSLYRIACEDVFVKNIQGVAVDALRVAAKALFDSKPQRETAEFDKLIMDELSKGNLKNLPVIEFDASGFPINCHEILRGIPYIFAGLRQRKTEAWLRRENAVEINGLMIWGEVELNEEQIPCNYGKCANTSGYTSGFIWNTKNSFKIPSYERTWSVNDPSTLEPLGLI